MMRVLVAALLAVSYSVRGFPSKQLGSRIKIRLQVVEMEPKNEKWGKFLDDTASKVLVVSISAVGSIASAALYEKIGDLKETTKSSITELGVRPCRALRGSRGLRRLEGRGWCSIQAGQGAPGPSPARAAWPPRSRPATVTGLCRGGHPRGDVHRSH